MAHETRNTYTASTHTRVLVAFYTHEDNGLTIDEPTESDPRLGHVVGFSYEKHFGPASGTWTLTFKRNHHQIGSAVRLWKDPEGVWVKVKIQVDGQVIDRLFGIVDGITGDDARAGMGQRSETYSIRGRDFGKAFETTELWTNLFHRPDDVLRSVGALTSTMIDRIRGTPAHFVRVLLEEWMGNSGTAETQWMLPPGLGRGSLYDLLLDGGRVRGIEPMGEREHGVALATTLLQIDLSGSKLWDTLQEWSNPALNELFVDLGPPVGAGPRDLASLVPKVYLRERPFPMRSGDGRSSARARWEALRTHTLRPGDVRKRQITRGGSAHRYNYWLIQAEGIGTEGFNIAEIIQCGVDGVDYGHPGNIPIFDPTSIQRYGVRRYTATTRFAPVYMTEDQDNFFRMLAWWLKKIHDWYVAARRELSGTIETAGRCPEIRIGERVREECANGEVITYYVEGVADTYSYPHGGSTTLTLTRGEFDDEDLLGDAYQAYEQRAPDALERCGVAPGEDLDEFLDQLASGCDTALPTGQVEGYTTSADVTSVEGDDFTIAPTQRTLEAERDGTADEPSPEAPAVAESATDPLVVPNPDSENGPNAPPAEESTFNGEALERGDPIGEDGAYIDPIEGLENAGV